MSVVGKKVFPVAVAVIEFSVAVWGPGEKHLRDLEIKKSSLQFLFFVFKCEAFSGYQKRRAYAMNLLSSPLKLLVSCWKK